MVSRQKFTKWSAGKCQFMPSVSPSHLHSVSSVPIIIAQIDILRILRGCSQFYTTTILLVTTLTSAVDVIRGSFERYLWVIHESSNAVTWPDLNISQPAWAIIAPLSMQNLWQSKTGLILGGGGEGPVWSHPRVDDHRSSVANSLAPLSLHITPIISCRRRLPVEETLLGRNCLHFLH